MTDTTPVNPKIGCQCGCELQVDDAFVALLQNLPPDLTDAVQDKVQAAYHAGACLVISLQTEMKGLQDEALLYAKGFVRHRKRDGIVQWGPPKEAKGIHKGMRWCRGAAAKLAVTFPDV